MAKNSKDKLAKKNEESTFLAPAEDDLFTDEEVKESLVGSTPRLPQIGIVHGGAGLLETPDKQHVSEIVGIILHSSRANVYWKPTEDETAPPTPPDCCSLDGIVPVPQSPNEDPEAPYASTCGSCPFNVFGSDPKGKGKACKQMRRLHIYTAAGNIPYRLTLPPTSLRSWDEYVTLLADKKVPYKGALTRIFTEKREAGQYKWTAVRFEFVSLFNDMQPEDARKNKKKFLSDYQLLQGLIENWREVMQEQEIKAEEFTGEANSAGQDEDETPF